MKNPKFYNENTTSIFDRKELETALQDILQNPPPKTTIRLYKYFVRIGYVKIPAVRKGEPRQAQVTKEQLNLLLTFLQVQQASTISIDPSGYVSIGMLTIITN